MAHSTSHALSSAFMTQFLRNAGGTAIVDGGLATELERHGADLNDPLWSAKCLLTSPHLIHRVYLQFFGFLIAFVILFSFKEKKNIYNVDLSIIRIAFSIFNFYSLILLTIYVVLKSQL